MYERVKNDYVFLGLPVTLVTFDWRYHRVDEREWLRFIREFKHRTLALWQSESG